MLSSLFEKLCEINNNLKLYFFINFENSRWQTNEPLQQIEVPLMQMKIPRQCGTINTKSKGCIVQVRARGNKIFVINSQPRSAKA